MLPVSSIYVCALINFFKLYTAPEIADRTELEELSIIQIINYPLLVHRKIKLHCHIRLMICFIKHDAR